MKIIKEDLKLISKEINLDISNQHLDLIYDIFKKISANLELLKNIDVKNIKPLNMIFEDGINFLLKSDECKNNLNKKDVLLNASNVEDDLIIVDKVI